MKNFITIKSVGSGIAEVQEDFVLCEEPLSRLVFSAQIHNKGIKGKIIRQRREAKDDIWKPDKAIDIRSLGKLESINLSMNTGAVNKFYLAIVKLANILKERGIEYGENKYTVVDVDSLVINNQNIATIIKKIIDAGHDEKALNIISEFTPSLVMEFFEKKAKEEKQVIIKEFEERLRIGGFSETTGNNSWQEWIYKNNWLFGVNYKKPIEKIKINITGIMPDYLFPTLDWFVDILEIKLPDDEVVIEDRSHPGSWKWTPATNIAIGQVVNYLGEIDRFRLEIEKNVKVAYGHEICLLKPRAYILIGNSSTWSNSKKEGLRKMNHALHGIEVLTYKDLLERGRQIVNI